VEAQAHRLGLERRSGVECRRHPQMQILGQPDLQAILHDDATVGPTFDEERGKRASSGNRKLPSVFEVGAGYGPWIVRECAEVPRHGIRAKDDVVVLIFTRLVERSNGPSAARANPESARPSTWAPTTNGSSSYDEIGMTRAFSNAPPGHAKATNRLIATPALAARSFLILSAS